jgi:hypothetical protein
VPPTPGFESFLFGLILPFFVITCQDSSSSDFCLEGGSIFIHNISNHPQDYTSSQPRKPQCKSLPLETADLICIAVPVWMKMISIQKLYIVRCAYVSRKSILKAKKYIL